MKKQIASGGILVWVLLIIASGSNLVIDFSGGEWTGWTTYSLVATIVCIVGLIVTIIERRKPTAE